MAINDAAPEEWDQAYRKVTAEDPVIKPRDPMEMQIGGDHYAAKKFQPIEYIHANNLDFMEGNVVKYITRHRDKGGADDIMKAIHYCKLILKYSYSNWGIQQKPTEGDL